MGCLQSKKAPSHSGDLSLMVFDVDNVDENGQKYSSGKLQVTDTDIILYREGTEMTLWPLHSLRRYGFDNGIFSFEAGRKCATGEGMYAFRCKKAELIFLILQEKIELRNRLHEEMRLAARNVSPIIPYRLAPGTFPDEDVPPPISAATLAAILPPSPTLPSVANFDEKTPLYPPSTPNGGFDNTVPITDVVIKREHNNNKSGTPAEPHTYCNDVHRELAALRKALHEKTIQTWLEIQEDEQFLRSKKEWEAQQLAEKEKAEKEKAEKEEVDKEAVGKECLKEASPLSPTFSCTSDISPLSSEQQVQESRMYMNLNTGTKSENWALANMSRNSCSPATPTTPSLRTPEYCNVSVKAEINTYANLALREISDSVSSLKSNKFLFEVPVSNPKVSESDTANSMSPLEDMEVNYAILDIDLSKDSSNRSLKDLVSPDRTSEGSSRNDSTASASGSGSSAARVRLLSQQSLDGATPSIGYTTIDFDKTVALTSVASGSSGNDLDTDGVRRTRHNSTNVICSSPNGVDKNKVFS